MYASINWVVKEGCATPEIMAVQETSHKEVQVLLALQCIFLKELWIVERA